MIIENGDSKFTEEEKQNLVVREYTSEEIEKNKKAYVNKKHKKVFSTNSPNSVMQYLFLYITRHVICS